MNNMRLLMLFAVFMNLNIAALFEYGKAVNAAQQNNWPVAEKKLQQLLIDDPDNPELLYDLGVACYKINNFDMARVYFDQAASQKASTASLKERAHFNAGNTAVAQKKLEEAIEQYESVLELNPENERARHNLELVKKMLEEQKKQDQQQQKQDQQKQNQQKKDDNSKNSEQQDQSQDQENSNLENKQENQNQSNNDSSQSNDTQSQDKKGDSDQEKENKGQKNGQKKSNSLQDKGSENKQQDKEQENGAGNQQSGNGQKKDTKDSIGGNEKKSQQSEGFKQGASSNKDSLSGSNDAAQEPMTPHDRMIAQIMSKQEQSDAQINKQLIKHSANKRMSGNHGKNRW